MLPVDSQQYVQAIVEAVDGGRSQANQCRRLTAADLWPDRANHHAVEPGAGRGRQQHLAGRDDAGTALAEQGDGKGARASGLICHSGAPSRSVC